MSLYAERLPATSFNGYPPLGVNATCVPYRLHDEYQIRFNGHPPLGVNATRYEAGELDPTYTGFNGHPPLGVNATADKPPQLILCAN